jgi:hypothetical protein
LPLRGAPSNNPNGRPVGSRNKRDAELFARLEQRGDRLAVDILSEIANDKNEPKPLRIQAAIGVAPYQTAKLGLLSAPSPLVYTTVPALPHLACTDIRHAIENIEFLSALRRDGKLDAASADAAISDMRLVRDGLIEEQKLIAAHGGQKDKRIQIVGGLPPLPATEIDFGGTEFAARVAAAQAHPAVVNGERALEGHITPTTDAIPPDPTWPHTPKKPDDRT